MAQQLNFKKRDFCLKAIDLAERSLRLVRDLNELIGNYTDNQFAPGDPNQIVDGDLDFPNSTIAHLTPTLLNQFISAATNIITLTPVQRTALRRMTKRPLGSQTDD